MTTDQQPNKKPTPVDTEQIAEGLRGESFTTKVQVKLMAAIGVIRHSKLPDDMVADFTMALIDSITTDFKLAALRDVQERYETITKNPPAGISHANISNANIMIAVVATTGLNLLELSRSREAHLRNLSAMFDDEVGGPPVFI